MRVRADTDKCVSSGNCVLTAEKVFDQTDNGFVVVVDADPPVEEHDRVRRAVSMCPVSAISVEEDEM